MLFDGLMKQSIVIRRMFRTLGILAAVWVGAMISSCAVFNWRYQQWNAEVVRNDAGVLSHAEARSFGHGDHALLLIHGFGDGPHVWDPLALELEAQGFAVRCMRLPGWNEPIEVKRRIQLEDWEEAVTREFNALSATHKSTGILAHSLGGALAVSMVQSGALQPEALVLYAPMFAISNDRSPLLPTRTWFRIGQTLLPDGMILESLFEEQSETGRARPRTRRDPFVPVHLYKEIYRLIDRNKNSSPVLPCPVRLVLPANDRVVDSKAASRWLTSIQAPSSQVVTPPRTGHLLPLDLDPQQESQQIKTWYHAQRLLP